VDQRVDERGLLVTVHRRGRDLTRLCAGDLRHGKHLCHSLASPFMDGRVVHTNRTNARPRPASRSVGGFGQTAVAAYVTTYGASTAWAGLDRGRRPPRDPASAKGFRPPQPVRAEVDNPPRRFVGSGRLGGGARSRPPH